MTPAFVSPALTVRRLFRPRTLAPMRMCATGAAPAPQARKDVVAHTARLAHLDLSDEQIERIVPDFDKMVQFVDSINQLELPDDATKESSGRPASGDELRPDEPVTFPYVDDIMAQAPHVEGDCFVVPRIASE